MDILESILIKAKSNIQKVAFPEACEEKILLTIDDLRQSTEAEKKTHQVLL